MSLKTFLVDPRNILELMVLSTACAQYLKPPPKKNTPQSWYKGKTRDLVDSLVERCAKGIGVQLHFNFQFFLIVWALAIGVAWLFLALSVDDALLILVLKGSPSMPNTHASFGWSCCILDRWQKFLYFMWNSHDQCVLIYFLFIFHLHIMVWPMESVVLPTCPWGFLFLNGKSKLAIWSCKSCKLVARLSKVKAIDLDNVEYFWRTS